jgi:hypothetical protein
VTTEPAASAEIVAVEAPAREPLDQIRDLLAEACVLAAQDLRTDTASAAAFLICVLSRMPVIDAPTLH